MDGVLVTAAMAPVSGGLLRPVVLHWQLARLVYVHTDCLPHITLHIPAHDCEHWRVIGALALHMLENNSRESPGDQAIGLKGTKEGGGGGRDAPLECACS